jgi:hypothetical protein
LALRCFSSLWACHAGRNTKLIQFVIRGRFSLFNRCAVRALSGEASLLPYTQNGRERPRKLFGRIEARKSGVAPARFGDLFSGAFLRRDLLTAFAFVGLADEEGEGLREESDAG